MQGFQLTFFTQQDRNHKGRPLAKWLLEEARDIGIGGATLIPATEGFGHDRKLRSRQAGPESCSIAGHWVSYLGSLKGGSHNSLACYLTEGAISGRSSQANPMSRFMWLFTPVGIRPDALPS